MPGECLPASILHPSGGKSADYGFLFSLCRVPVAILLCILLVSSVSAAEYVLDASSAGGYRDGFRYNGTEDLTLVIADNVTIRSTGTAGIFSATPVTIRSPAGKTLSVFVDNASLMLFGVGAPAVSVESGTIDVTVNGTNDPAKGNAFGIWAGHGNVTITGGSVTTTVATTGHKNKGIYASRYIVVTGGSVSADQHGGMNTFGLDGGDIGKGRPDGGVVITGGTVLVNSTGGHNRNFGIDSRFGSVRISGTPVIVISEDGSGAQENFAYNSSITMIAGGLPVVATSEGGRAYELRSWGRLALPGAAS